MNNHGKCGIEDLLQLFENTLAPEDILFSKLMAQVSTAITKERLKLGMSQADFAEYIKSSQSLVSRWEHGDYNFTIKKITQIAVKLGLDVNIEMTVPHSNGNSKTFTNRQYFLNNATIYYSEQAFNRNLNTTYKSTSPFRTLQSTHKEDYFHASIC